MKLRTQIRRLHTFRQTRLPRRYSLSRGKPKEEELKTNYVEVLKSPAWKRSRLGRFGQSGGLNISV